MPVAISNYLQLLLLKSSKICECVCMTCICENQSKNVDLGKRNVDLGKGNVNLGKGLSRHQRNIE